MDTMRDPLAAHLWARQMKDTQLAKTVASRIRSMSTRDKEAFAAANDTVMKLARKAEVNPYTWLMLYPARALHLSEPELVLAALLEFCIRTEKGIEAYDIISKMPVTFAEQLNNFISFSRCDKGAKPLLPQLKKYMDVLGIKDDRNGARI